MKTEKSKIAFTEAQKYLVGGVNSPARAFGGVGGTPIFFKHAQGSKLTSLDDETYTDFVGGWGPMILGHRPKEVISALNEMLTQATSYGAPTTIETEMAATICNAFPSIEKVRMVSSGTEAAFSALRLARGYKKRDMLIKFEGCYHGHGDSFLVEAGSGALTLGAPSPPGVPSKLANLTLLAQFNNLESVEAQINANKNQIAAIVLEPVVGNMGLVAPQPGFLHGLRSLCDKHDILLVFDEVMTGFRLSLSGAQGIYDVKPDLTCLGKIIGGGLPAGAYGGKKEIMQCISPEGKVYQAGTLSGNPLAMASGLSCISTLQNNPHIYNNLEKIGNSIETELSNFIKHYGIAANVARVGSMFTVFFSEQPITHYGEAKQCNTKRYAQFFHHLLDKGIYFPPSQFEATFLSSQHDEADIGAMLDAAKSAFEEISKS